MGWMNNANPVLITDVSHPSHRGISSALYMTLGALSRHGSHSGPAPGTPSGPAVPHRSFNSSCLRLPSRGSCSSPESPRWLVSVGRSGDARKALVAHHAAGNNESPYVDTELRNIQAAITAEFEAEEHSTYAELVRNPGNRLRK
ncbi:hypothetical protein BJY01DRAFT_222198 [Aspergillus pseudoustus]|uniref:Uncharacterized protein n=1 Tax=Aspergillus pseudoustus TaxID=1810923 RepID=A0ABR4J8F6_9EURO